MFNKHLLLCLAVIAGNSWAHDESINQWMLNNEKKQLSSLNNKIEKLEHKNLDIATRLASNEYAAGQVRTAKYITSCVILMRYVGGMCKKSDDSYLFRLAKLTAEMLPFYTIAYRVSAENNQLSTKVNCQKEALKNIDTRLEKLMHQKKQLLEESSKIGMTGIVQTREQADVQ